MLVQDIELQLVRPPVTVYHTAGSVFLAPAGYRALAVFIHNVPSGFYLVPVRSQGLYLSI